MVIDAKHLGDTILNTAYAAKGEVTVKIDIGGWTDDEVRTLLDTILAGLNSHKLRFKGVRTDTTGFVKLGIEQDRINSGLYHGVPVVMTPTVNFDVMELVLRPL